MTAAPTAWARVVRADAWIAATCAALLLPFVLAPGLDLAVARAFDGSRGGWPAALRNLDTGVSTVALAAAVAVGVLSAAALARLRWPRLPAPDWRRPAYAALVLALGPGLLVNGVLKTFWGRPRPRHLAEFGGTMEFVPVHRYSGQCTANCSLASGDVSVGFALLVSALVLPAPLRLPALVAAGAWTLAVIGQRLAALAHFPSDVLAAGAAVAGVAALVALAFARLRLPQ